MFFLFFYRAGDVGDELPFKVIEWSRDAKCILGSRSYMGGGAEEAPAKAAKKGAKPEEPQVEMPKVEKTARWPFRSGRTESFYGSRGEARQESYQEGC